MFLTRTSATFWLFLISFLGKVYLNVVVTRPEAVVANAAASL